VRHQNTTSQTNEVTHFDVCAIYFGTLDNYLMPRLSVILLADRAKTGKLLPLMPRELFPILVRNQRKSLQTLENSTGTASISGQSLRPQNCKLE
jgi:hypothetical protein